ncbi:FAD-binding protein [Fusarium tjaetaba]|uniref:L-ornithine N(5)-monooxygenase [NAD(P)H] n=1 Tax=Fusarium tjaetaba TaxID=1567544 RepID=A0A8H5RTI0_9HYPO|nr:FAD-binding protein [Fusarium tjaetaba]KAF5638182.1 FAD-binding protein [Fusarium tjaetaba]
MSSIQVEEEIYDVLVIGAGPCGLAISARLHEHTPAALFTDEEHRRFHWISKYGNKMPLKHVRSGKISPPKQAAKPQYKMLVLDADSDTWMGRWNRLFKMYDISHLRSPMLWHVDPLDRDALLAHAYANDRADELVEIRNCVGKEVSKHGRKKSGQRACGRRQEARVDINVRERNDYYNPSTSLFCDHCEKVAARYNLSSNMIRKESLQHLDYDEVKGISIDGEKLFTVTTNKTCRYARTVVLAVGPANVAKIPRIPSMPDSNLPQTCHSMHITEFPDPIVKARIAAKKTTDILIVGGGLTSAQLTDLAIRKGVTKVWHVMRGPLRIKHFDVGLEWMGKFKNAKQAQFYYADSDDERIEMIKEARGGGSITPVFHKRLKKHLLTKKLELFTETSLTDAQFDAEKGTWSVQTNPPTEMPAMDYMYFATGIQTDFSSLPYLQTILSKYPIEGRGGFPCINNDLMWNDDVPLFMMGRLAALRLGPAAPNLGGAQVGAERIAWAIEDRVARAGEDEGEDYRKGARKVKCDETWPRCKRCLTTGRTCTGYIAPPPGSFSWTSLLRIKPQTLPITNSKEVRSLSFFHHVVAPVLSGPFDGSFWTYFVVQMAQSEPAARHAVLAISSLFESFEPAKESAADEFAIMHYNKAISILTRDSKPCVDTVLLVCMMFICIEFLRGNREAAITHASHGVHLLNSEGHKSRLANTFAQMSVFPLFFIEVGTDFPLLQGDEAADLKSPVFYTISEAQHALEHLSIRIIKLVRDGNAFRLHVVDEEPQEWVLDEQAEAKQDLEAWGLAFERFRAFADAREEDLTVLALITRYRLMKIWIVNCFERGEMEYDSMKEDFVTIVECARKAAEYHEVQRTTPGKFMFNVGFNPMLHFTVWKCRYLSLRIEALSLMRRLSSQQEALWDAALMYNVSRRIIEVEHGIDLCGDYDINDAILPPDENRVKGFFFRESPEVESVMWDKNAETVYFLVAHPEGGVIYRKDYVRNKHLVLDSGQTFWM